MNKNIELIGYCGPTPLAIILWRKDGEAISKTICYDESEVMHMYERYNTPGDMYNTLEPAIYNTEAEALHAS